MFKKSILILSLIIILLSSSLVNGQAIYIDRTNLNKGVIKINYESSEAAVKVMKGKTSYDYILNGNNSLPLQLGNGKYTIYILEKVEGEKYKQVYKETITVNLKNEKDVYLQSIQMINWNGEMEAIKKAEDLTKNAKTNMEKVAAIYNYIIKNISYDTKKANIINRKSNYIPDIDKIFEAQIGICYDYASLFAAMLRSQGIPTKLVMGYNQDINEYHAWNEVYIEEIDQWVIIDTTYDAGINNMEKVSMIKDAKEYKAEKSY